MSIAVENWPLPHRDGKIKKITRRYHTVMVKSKRLTHRYRTAMVKSKNLPRRCRAATKNNHTATAMV